MLRKTVLPFFLFLVPFQIGMSFLALVIFNSYR